MSHAAPVVKDGFSYAGDSLYVEVSGHNRHPRANVPELKAIFHPTTASEIARDPAGHWYEAQLLHYGLPPSRSKAVAKTRLLDAVNKGKLVVPTQIQKLEAELKKEWTKNEREARAELKKESASTLKGTKRKVESDHGIGGSGGSFNLNVSFNIDMTRDAPRISSTEAPAAKKSKPTASNRTANTSTTSPTRPRSEWPKQTARGGPAGLGSERETTTSTTAGPRPMARCSGRGGASMGRGQYPGKPKVEPDVKDDFNNFPTGSGSGYASQGDYDPKPYDYNYTPSPPRTTGKIGLLNGRYEINCPGLEQWEQFNDHQFSLILTLQGNSIWGAYDFGMFSGIIYLPQRPYEASDATYEFKWRGRENSEGMMSYSEDQYGFLRFLGDGQIEGVISVYGEAKFRGMRVSGQQTRSERDAWSMKQEWDGYNEEEYERENRARWGGSRW